MAFFNLWGRNERIYASWLFISANKSCACYKLFNLAARLGIESRYKITNTGEPLDKEIHQSLKEGRNLAVAVHGRSSSTLAFFKSDLNDFKTETIIDNSWWKQFNVKSNILYFHVCYGANILRSDSLIKHFTYWVSYSDEVVHAVSGNDLMRQLSETCISQFDNLLQNQYDIEAFYSETKLIYENIILTLSESDSSESILIHMGLMQNNLDCLSYSNN